MRTVALALAIVTGCAPPAPPPLPPLVLQPQAAHFEAMLEHLPAMPTAKRMAELHDLTDMAFLPGASAPRIATMIKRDLLASADASAALEAALAHDHPAVRSNAAYELGQRGVQAALVPLLYAFKYETDTGVAIWISGALAALRNHAGLPRLISAMDDADHADAAGQRALEFWSASDIEVGQAPSFRQLQQALQGLLRHWRQHGHTGNESPELTPATAARVAEKLLALREFQLRPVDDARFILSRLGSLPLTPLRTALTAEETYLRVHALEVVRAIGPPALAIADAVLPLTRDPLVRGQAIETLGRLHAIDTAPQVRALLDDPDIEVRAAAAGALGPMGDRSAADRLQTMLDDERQPMDVRVMAAYSLAWFELERPALAFLERLRRDDGYHAPTLDELIDSIATAAQRARMTPPSNHTGGR